MSPRPGALVIHTRTAFLDLAPSQGSLIELVDDAGDANHDGFRDVLVFVDRPDRLGGHRRQIVLVLGRRRLISSTLAQALHRGQARRLKGPNPILPQHGYRAPSNVGDVDGDGQRDYARVEIDRSEAHYQCGGDTPYCVRLYLAARLSVRSPSGRLVLDHCGDWVRVITRGPYPDNTYGWAGDWNSDGRSDLFEADPGGVSIFAQTASGLRRVSLQAIAPPTASTPYRPITLDLNHDGTAEVIGAGVHGNRLALSIVSAR